MWSLESGLLEHKRKDCSLESSKRDVSTFRPEYFARENSVTLRPSGSVLGNVRSIVDTVCDLSSEKD